MQARDGSARAAGALLSLMAFAVSAFALLAPCVAWAHEYCVGDVTALNNALVIAASPTGETTVIKVRQGTYDVRGTRLIVDSDYGYVDFNVNALQLLGGYADADCATRVLTPSSTIFDAHGEGMFLEMVGSLRVENIQWQYFGNDIGAGFNFPIHGHDFSAVLYNNIFIDAPLTLRIFDDTGVHGEFDLVNNLFVAPANLYNPASGIVDLEDDGADGDYENPGSNVAMRVLSNTIVGSPGVGLHLFTTGDTVLANNIVWGSTGFDVRIDGDGHAQGSAVFLDNSYPSGSLFGTEALGSLGTSHADPLFAGGNDYHLQNASPAINSGTTGVTIASTDLDGHARVVGSTIDRGAYESAINDTVPQVITVTNANASGAGSLYQALVDANTNGDFNYIQFSIPGSCPITIASPALPAIQYGVKIDGYTQPGSAPNTATVGDNATRCIVLDGGGAASTGLSFAGGSTTHIWVQGLAFGGFTGSALSLSGGNGDVVVGNQFGGKVGSLALGGNGTDIKLAQAARNALIGYDAPAFRNVIDSAADYGISIGALGSTSTGHSIAGNLFGFYGSGLFIGSAGNAVALRVTTGGNAIVSNLFGNNGQAIELAGANAAANTLQYNGIGRVPSSCVVINHVQQCLGGTMPNQGGVAIDNGAHGNVLESNTIWGNAFGGIQINGASEGNFLWANSLDANDGDAIALGSTTDGDNDAASGAASLPNRGLNSPVALRAVGGTVNGAVDGTLDSINGDYRIQVYASLPPADDYDRYGETFVGSGMATIAHQPIGANGHTSFHVAFSSPGATLAGTQITLLASDSDGNTSMFSAAVPYQCDVIFRNGFDDATADGCPAP